MQRDDVGLLSRESPQSAVAERDVAVGGPMEPVAAAAGTTVEVIRNGIQIRLLRNRMMERGIEDCHLGNGLTEEFARGPNALEVVWIVKWGKVDAVFDPLQHLVVNQGRFREHLAAMHHAMSHGMDIGRTLDLLHV